MYFKEISVVSTYIYVQVTNVPEIPDDIVPSFTHGS